LHAIKSFPVNWEWMPGNT